MKVLFVSNNKQDWGNSPATTTTSSKFDAARVPYALEVPDNTQMPMKDYHADPAGDTVWYHFKCYVDSPWGGLDDGQFADIFDSSGTRIAYLDTLDGKLRAVASGDSNVIGANYLMAFSGTIVDFDVKVVSNASNIICELYIGQALVSSATAANTGGKGKPRRFDFNLVDTLPNSVPIAVSEFIASEDDPRNARVDRVDPTTFGTHSGWSGAVSVLSDEDDTTGLIASTSGLRTSANKANFSSGGTIAAFVAVARASAAAGGPQTLRQSLTIGGTDYDAAGHTLSVGVGTYAQLWETDPSTGAAWTQAGLNAAELGMLSAA